MPLTLRNDLQESAPLLLLTFLLGLWMIRDHRTILYTLVLTIGALNNETMLILPLVFFAYNLTEKSWTGVLRAVALTAITSLPAYLVAGIIRYITRERPHLEGAWHLPDNLEGIWRDLHTPILQLWTAHYVFPIILFGAFWVFAFLGLSNKPLFLRRAAIMVPVFVLIHVLTGVIAEPRQLLPLSYIILPLSFCYLFPEAVVHEPP